MSEQDELAAYEPELAFMASTALLERRTARAELEAADAALARVGGPTWDGGLVDRYQAAQARLAEAEERMDAYAVFVLPPGWSDR